MALDNVTQLALRDIVEILLKADYAFFDSGFDISVSDKESSPIKATLTVVVPRGQKSNVGEDLIKKLDLWRAESSKSYNYLNLYLGKYVEDKTRIKIILKEESVPKTFEKGSGGGSGNTAIVESAQCLYCALVFNNGSEIDEKSLISKDDFENAYSKIEVDASLDEILSMSSAWKTSSIRGANKLFDTLPRGNYKFYRNKGVDEEINKAYNRIKNDKVSVLAENISDSVPASEDKWNPADIWITNKNFNESEISDAAEARLVLNFNQFLIDKFNKNELIGVSLKKITGQAHIEPMNLTKDRNIDNVGYGGATFNYKTLDTYIDFKSGSNTSIQFRNFSGSKGSWQGEVGIKGSSAKHGKIGGGAIWEILKSHGIKSFNANDNQQFYNDCGIEGKKKAIAEEIYELLKKVPAANYNVSTTNKEQEITKIVYMEPEEKDKPAKPNHPQRWMYTKFLGLTLIDAINGGGISTEKKDEIVQDIYLYASSQHTLSGVYYKLT